MGPRRARAEDGSRPVDRVDLMERGFVSAIATNGAAIIHDFEIALSGATSEDVEASLGPGRFGMAEETGRLLNEAISDGVARGLGLRAISGGLSPARASRSSGARAGARRGASSRRAGHRARGPGHRHHPYASGRLGRLRSAKAACATSATSSRMSRSSNTACI